MGGEGIGNPRAGVILHAAQFGHGGGADAAWIVGVDRGLDRVAHGGGIKKLSRRNDQIRREAVRVVRSGGFRSPRGQCCWGLGQG